MKTIAITLALLCISGGLFGQSTLEKTYALGPQEKLALQFDYPQLIQLRTWNKQEVLIKARVFINGEEVRDDFKLLDSRKSGVLLIESQLENLDKYKSQYIFIDEDIEESKNVSIKRGGKTLVFGNGKGSYHNGTRIDIELEVFVPKEGEVEVEARYGLVEVVEMPKMLEIVATYGGADVKVAEPSLKELEVSTSWGQIFSNLTSPIQVTGGERIGEQMVASYSASKGAESVRIKSKYGHIYLRNN
ncbi:hypothetical protein [Roseivirga sp. UBA838]|uniref:hypothetical protein n=1 Tax=Roseivirga sp. UBA838 TaxID=1947393 RepID=UPI00257F7E30|nr:hypothetical protein [Roseivirga sp. UBA838]